MFTCKYCQSTSAPIEYIVFFQSELIRQAQKIQKILPKYGFHIGLDCSDCHKWNVWKKQDDGILGKKFFPTK